MNSRTKLFITAGVVVFIALILPLLVIFYSILIFGDGGFSAEQISVAFMMCMVGALIEFILAVSWVLVKDDEI